MNCLCLHPYWLELTVQVDKTWIHVDRLSQWKFNEGQSSYLQRGFYEDSIFLLHATLIPVVLLCITFFACVWTKISLSLEIYCSEENNNEHFVDIRIWRYRMFVTPPKHENCTRCRIASNLPDNCCVLSSRYCFSSNHNGSHYKP